MTDWMETNRGTVFPKHCDHLGHMNTRYYGHFFDEANWHIWVKAGIDHAMFDRLGAIVVIGRITTEFIQEVKAGDLIVIEGVFRKLGSKSISYEQRLRHAEKGYVCAKEFVTEVCFDPLTRKSTEMPDELRQIIKAHLVPGDEEAA